MLSEDGRTELETIAEKRGATLLLLRAGGEDAMFFLPGAPQVKEVEIGAQTMASLIDLVASLVDPSSAPQLFEIGRTLNETSIAARTEGRYYAATLCNRFSLAITWYFRAWTQVELLTRNLHFIWASLNDLLRVNVTPPYPDGPQTATLTNLPYIAGDILLTPGNESDEDRYIRLSAELIREDAIEFCKRSAASRAAAPQEEHDWLSWLESLCRFARMAGHKDAVRLLRQLCETAALSGRHYIALSALLEHLADVTLEDFLFSGSLASEKSPESRDLDPGGLREVWLLFLRERDYAEDAPNVDAILWRYTFAYRQLQCLHRQATSKGGFSWSQLSHQISEYLQKIGCDYIRLLQRVGASDLAFTTAEQVHAQSMVNRMARSHHTNRLARDRRLHGSVNSVMPAGLSEIQATAKRLQASLLLYLRGQHGYDVWAQLPGGDLIVGQIPDPSALLTDLFAQLPYMQSAVGAPLKHGQRPGDWTETSRAALDACLGKLYHALLPADIAPALREAGERLIVLPDSQLEYVPFCALRTEDGAYLVEQFEVAYWPSVTAWMLTQTAAKTRAAVPADTLRSMCRCRRFVDEGNAPVSKSPRAVVVGDPAFSDVFGVQEAGKQRQLRLSQPPETRREADAVAKLLGGVQLIGSDASLENMLNQCNVVPVLHLATHGVCVAERPEESFIALSDRALTARFLQEYDRPIIVELVVMSVCETALDGEHPDNLIGLSNAFLMAGANTVASTLWTTDDDQRIDLVTRFYGELLQGVPVPTALRSAQLDILRQPELSHPQHWAAFKVIGNAANPLGSPERL